MADNRFMNTSAAEATQVDVGLRAYMLGVYNHMTTALCLPASSPMAPDAGHNHWPGRADVPDLVRVALFNSPLQWVVMLAPLGMVFWLSARMQAMSASKARNMFYVYAGLMGLSLASILMVYTGASVAGLLHHRRRLAGLSLYGYSTKRSLSAMGSFMVIGLIGLILASLVNIFLASTQLDFVISIVGVLIFAGLTAWDTQRIKLMYMAGDSQAETTKKSIFGALMLYLDFINMFLFILRLFGNRE